MDEGEEMYVTSIQIFSVLLSSSNLEFNICLCSLGKCLFAFIFIDPLSLYIKILCKSKVW